MTNRGARPVGVTLCGRFTSAAADALAQDSARGAARWARPSLEPRPGSRSLTTGIYWIGVPELVVSVITSATESVKIVPDVLVPKNRMLTSIGFAFAK